MLYFKHVDFQQFLERLHTTQDLKLNVKNIYLILFAWFGVEESQQKEV